MVPIYMVASLMDVSRRFPKVALLRLSHARIIFVTAYLPIVAGIVARLHYPVMDTTMPEWLFPIVVCLSLVLTTFGTGLTIWVAEQEHDFVLAHWASGLRVFLAYANRRLLNIGVALTSANTTSGTTSSKKPKFQSRS